MATGADGYGVTMFMFRFTTAPAGSKDVLVLSQAGRTVSQPTAPRYCVPYVYMMRLA